MVTVVKVGGSILGQGVDSSILDDIHKILTTSKLVLVHGGGKDVTKIAERMGKPQRFIVSPGGIRSRYTDRETASIFTMVMSGKINKEIVSSLQKMKLNAIGLSGIDGGIIRAERKKRLIVKDERGRKKMIDGGFTGKIQKLNPEPIDILLEKGYLPVVSPVALSEEYEFLNVDGDRAAAYLAGSMKAEKVIFLTDVSGVLEGNKLIDNLNIADAEKILPRLGFGMEKKVLASIEALKMGVRESIISSGLRTNPILNAIEGKNCTVIHH